MKMQPAKSENWESDLEWIETADELFKVKRQLKRLREEDSRLSKKLQSLSDGRTVKKGRYEYKKGERKGAVDYSKIPILQGLDLDEFRKNPVTTWKLEVVE